MSLDTLTRIEDAIAVAIPAILSPATLTATVYKGSGVDEMTIPRIVIDADGEVPLEENTMPGDVLATIVTASVAVVTHADDSSRAAHAAIARDVESVVKRSVDQLKTAMNAAAISGLTVQLAQYAGASREYDGQTRKTIFRINITAYSI